MSSNDAPAPGFTMRELLEEIAGTPPAIDLGEELTTREMMPLFNVRTQASVRSRIRPLVEAGVLLAVRVQRENMVGFRSAVPAYAVNPTKTWDDVLSALTERR